MNSPLVIFVAMPGRDMGQHAAWRNTAEIKKYLYDPLAEQVGKALKAEVDLRIEKDKISQGAIYRSMFNEALHAPVYIVDLTGANANVYLELGVRWALRDHVTVLVCQNVDQDVKFNVSANRVIRYGRKPAELEKAREKIFDAILDGLKTKRVDSLVRQSLDMSNISRPVLDGRDGQLRTSLGMRIRALLDYQRFGRRRVIVATVIMCSVVVTLVGGSFYIGTRDPSGVRLTQLHEIGDDVQPIGDEYLAQVVNQATGKCIARNGFKSHPNESERAGEDIYQYDCGNNDDFSHMLALAPVKGGWLIRSSVKIDLCLAANGSPSDDQHWQDCATGDDRQQWTLRRIRGTESEVALIAVIENRNTRMCLANPDPPGLYPGKALAILQRPCAADAGMIWAIKRLPPIGAKDCHDEGSVRIRNRETILYVDGGDRPRVSGKSLAMTLAVAGQSAHGCVMKISNPSGGCMGASAAEVLWMPCNGQPNQRWVIESVDKENGQKWWQIRPGHDVSRCLQHSEEDSEGAPLVALPCHGVWPQHWSLE